MSANHAPQHGVKEPRGIWDDEKNIKRLIVAFLVTCGLSLVLDVFAHRHPSFDHNELPMELWWGFYCFYGFVACVLLVLVAKQMRRIVMRDENYYDD